SSMRWIRQRDMISACPGARSSTFTSAELCGRKTVACPAELPPPTIAISSPLQSCASMWVALYITPAPSKRESSERAGFRYLAPLAMTTVRVRTIETDGPPGDRHVRAELLGLHQ